jgi:hypothetical protein
MPFEILHGALVFFRRRAGFEGSEVTSLAGFRVDFAGIEPVFPRLQFSDHGMHRVLARPVRNNCVAGPLVPIRLFALSFGLAMPDRSAVAE